MVKIKNKEYQCSMELTIDLIGGKWKSLILWHLSKETLRFSELKRLLPKVTQKMLTQQLRDLENDGFIIRKVYAQVPPKVEYSLSDLGKSVVPILQLMCDWANEYIDHLCENVKDDKSPQ
ncbi:hxlR-like helix-turn-helix family protein [Clostridium argentinense CDC 2741]|uniref:HxlR-like helix-turn-helix family protein n=1 Tax=Clostridium argentinense CDC 2741 TaxID=1418104 RepID=A0A0C1QYE9_9CLOT|nr:MULTISPECIES: helix-turn-helix domain-containing protein [Clostridium]ARC85921.1 transcriptional regulator [Clostridium argentinense]KIE46047.1 hxlR-like helix-turn-helix family protein [Clostridium argentinense CDC 2741]NFF38849.1 helix-turn-helix transcriptional regulator [Clostridium argentinense]NFP48641.1 helix-turn-helix transcriptional regulator [Clostridium argentinense]NFP71091.1 helix-turn-helix transcriptional regulator [Clostridium argentinense]